LNPPPGSHTGPMGFIDNKGRLIPQVHPRFFTRKEGIKATIPISPPVISFGIVQIGVRFFNSKDGGRCMN
ncbi:MAG: hypothetical protein EZS28_049346, partial [Streblomastix strix]